MLGVGAGADRPHRPRRPPVGGAYALIGTNPDRASIMVGMNLWPRSPAQKQREALEHMGLAMIEGFRKGFADADARTAARPEGVTVEEWRRQGLAEIMAELDANPQHQRMVAAARMTFGDCDGCNEEGRL